jgi:type II secretory pathway component PulF
MPNFSYQAINESGATVSGVIEAGSIDMATNMIAAQGYIPSKVTEGGSGFRWPSLSGIKERLGSVKAPDLILFTKQFRTLLRGGVSILGILQVLEHQAENKRLKKIAGTMARDIKEGSTLYNAFRRHPKTFSELYSSMARAGESGGALPEVLDRLSYIIEHEHKVKSDIKAALQYPIIVIMALGIAFFVLLTFVIPKFVGVFENAGIDLPLPTVICMHAYQFLANYWYVCTGAVVGGIVGLAYYFKTGQGKYVRDAFILKLPVLGSLFVKAAMSRFASIFAILHSSGVPVLDSMKILSGTIGNAAIAREFDRIRDRVEEGRGISVPLKSAKYFTPMVINMVAIGEESGNLADMLREISSHCDDEVEYAIKRLSDAIVPVLTVGLAAVVGFFALSIFLPMWDLTKMVR